MSSSSSTTYSFSEEHSLEDIQLVKRLADEEQQRRTKDIAGEKLRRENANTASDLFSLNVRPTWFQLGTSYTLNIIKVAREAGNNLLRSSQVRAKVVGPKLQVVGQKGVAKAQDVKNRVVVAVPKAKEAALETALDVKGVVEEKLHLAAKQIKKASNKFVKKVSKAWDNLSENTSLAFAVLEEENERAYRMTSELQVHAMMNAFAVARLFKSMAPEFYRPAWEPSLTYGSKLLEEAERARRVALTDKTASDNAKAVAKLLEHKFAATTPTDAALIAAKAEVVEEIKEQAPRPLFEAKAQHVEEIKVHKPIPATM